MWSFCAASDDFSWISLQDDLLNHHRCFRNIIGSCGRTFNFIHHIHPLHHLAEHCVLAVQPRSRPRRYDEELTAVRVWTGIRICEYPADDFLAVNFVPKLISWPAGAPPSHLGIVF